MEGAYSLPVIAKDLKAQFDAELAASTLAKCTKSCFMSMQEQKLLPTEERCLRNCFVKTNDFNSYFEDELKYALRNLKWHPVDYYLNGLNLLVSWFIPDSILSQYLGALIRLSLFKCLARRVTISPKTFLGLAGVSRILLTK